MRMKNIFDHNLFDSMQGKTQNKEIKDLKKVKRLRKHTNIV